MDEKWMKLIGVVNIRLCVFLFICQKCHSVEDRNETKFYTRTDVDTVLTDCKTPEFKEGFCVIVTGCSLSVSTFNESYLDALKCSPSNAERTKPQICCEKKFVNFTATSTPANTTSESCGYQEIQIPSRIIGGTSSEEGEFPWLARLYRRTNEGYIHFTCAGALISSKIVLTSAHCLISEPLDKLGSLYSVSLGEHDANCDNCSEYRQTVMVSKFIVHPRFRIVARNYMNDIGLIKLSREVKFSSYISPICLLEETFEATSYFVSGWGRTEQGTTSSVKLKIEVPPYSWKQCAEKFRILNVTLTDRQICAGGVRGKDTCQGDSGGPLMVLKNGNQWFVAGLVSFGLGCGREGWPSVYTNIPSFINWIKNNID